MASASGMEHASEAENFVQIVAVVKYVLLICQLAVRHRQLIHVCHYAFHYKRLIGRCLRRRRIFFIYTYTGSRGLLQ